MVKPAVVGEGQIKGTSGWATDIRELVSKQEAVEVGWVIKTLIREGELKWVESNKCSVV